MWRYLLNHVTVTCKGSLLTCDQIFRINFRTIKISGVLPSRVYFQGLFQEGLHSSTFPGGMGTLVTYTCYKRCDKFCI